MDENDIAAEHLRAELRLRRFSGLRMAIDAVLGGGVVTVHDLVVTRLDTGAEVFRTKADTGDAHHLLGQVELDLETRTTAEFLREWNAT
ncbi:hypothetical protein Q0F99_06200 [Rathayibacter oskolensis]|uniref:hypothetical protein n=1 Tax=Rathayibacter oskolensis TaxID=1891671 RepID=UPI00265EBC53|nr:hypothetical protein [Rathayibacter oskolensis]WKK72531.1 hypothetical protein Q0F99_06200 [Rathayibacter oskolensis]